MVIAVPTGIKIFNWIGTMWGGQLRFRVPMLFAIAFVAQFVVGGLSGVIQLDERAGKVHFWVMAAGFNLTFFPMHIVGLRGMPRRVFTYPAGMGGISQQRSAPSRSPHPSRSFSATSPGRPVTAAAQVQTRGTRARSSGSPARRPQHTTSMRNQRSAAVTNCGIANTSWSTATRDGRRQRSAQPNSAPGTAGMRARTMTPSKHPRRGCPAPRTIR
jgi:hypothetical protein